MLYEVEWAEDGTYVPGEEFSPERFFNDGLKNSTEFDLKLGYFSSAAISVLAEGFATFISRGGTMRLIINHIVSPKDKEAINDGVMGNVIDCADLSNFQYLKSTFDEYQEQFFRCLAYMISQKRIDIRIIKPRGQKGIAHTKTGQFRDGLGILRCDRGFDLRIYSGYPHCESCPPSVYIAVIHFNPMLFLSASWRGKRPSTRYANVSLYQILLTRTRPVPHC